MEATPTISSGRLPMGGVVSALKVPPTGSGIECAIDDAIGAAGNNDFDVVHEAFARSKEK
jgi:hypothetical protein